MMTELSFWGELILRIGLADPLYLNNCTWELKDKARQTHHAKITIICKCANIYEVEGNKKSSNRPCKCKPWEFIESKEMIAVFSNTDAHISITVDFKTQ